MWSLFIILPAMFFVKGGFASSGVAAATPNIVVEHFTTKELCEAAHDKILSTTLHLYSADMSQPKAFCIQNQ